MNAINHLPMPLSVKQHAQMMRLFGGKPDATNLQDRIARGHTPLDRFMLAIEEAMAAADEARTSSECGRKVRHVMAMLADESTSALQTIVDDVLSKHDDDEEAACEESAAYRLQVQRDFRDGVL